MKEYSTTSADANHIFRSTIRTPYQPTDRPTDRTQARRSARDNEPKKNARNTKPQWERGKKTKKYGEDEKLCVESVRCSRAYGAMKNVRSCRIIYYTFFASIYCTQHDSHSFSHRNGNGKLVASQTLERYHRSQVVQQNGFVALPNRDRFFVF